MNIYQVSEQYLLALNELLAIEDLPDEVVRDTIESLQGDMEVKARNVAAYIKNIEAESFAVGEAVNQMTARKKRLDSEANKLREALKAGLQKCGMFDLKFPEFAIRVKFNPISVVVDDEAMIPLEFITEKITRCANKALMKSCMEAGSVIGGARLERKTRLEIK